MHEIAENRALRETIIYDLSLAPGVGDVVLVSLAAFSPRSRAHSHPRFGNGCRKRWDQPANYQIAVYLMAAFVGGLAPAIVAIEKLRITPGAAFSVGDWFANFHPSDRRHG
jgi:branched-chain amino acid transport system permease protein